MQYLYLRDLSSASQISPGTASARHQNAVQNFGAKDETLPTFGRGNGEQATGNSEGQKPRMRGDYVGRGLNPSPTPALLRVPYSLLLLTGPCKFCPLLRIEHRKFKGGKSCLQQ
ncbi:hypothetical protein BV372_18040 [Nostoc sp. T09]|nr:hypothetical protein BV372_18040 [Nostoc sp. T09]